MLRGFSATWTRIAALLVLACLLAFTIAPVDAPAGAPVGAPAGATTFEEDQLD